MGKGGGVEGVEIEAGKEKGVWWRGRGEGDLAAGRNKGLQRNITELRRGREAVVEMGTGSRSASPYKPFRLHLPFDRWTPTPAFIHSQLR